MMEMLEKTAAGAGAASFQSRRFQNRAGSRLVYPVGHADGASVAFGGSATCQRWGLAQLLRENGHGGSLALGSRARPSVPRCFIRR